MSRRAQGVDLVLACFACRVIQQIPGAVNQSSPCLFLTNGMGEQSCGRVVRCGSMPARLSGSSAEMYTRRG